MRPSSNAAGEPHQQLQPARRCQGDATAIEMPIWVRSGAILIGVRFRRSGAV
jgi:hypothetical protein